MPNKRRVREYITLRLSPEEDADLVAWWESIPGGEGAKMVKLAIRQMLGTAPTQTAATVADLERMALWLVGEMRGMALTPGQGRASPTPTAEGERLTDEEVQQRERAVRARKW